MPSAPTPTESGHPQPETAVSAATRFISCQWFAKAIPFSHYLFIHRKREDDGVKNRTGASNEPAIRGKAMVIECSICQARYRMRESRMQGFKGAEVKNAQPPRLASPEGKRRDPGWTGGFPSGTNPSRAAAGGGDDSTPNVA